MKLFIYIVFLITFIACKSQQEKDSLVDLHFSGETVKLPLDERTRSNVSTFFAYDTYYLLHNENTNEILFYDKNTKQLSKRIHFEEEGANGVGRFIGFFPLSINKFILTRPDLCELSIVTSQGIVEKRIRYDKNEDGELLIPYVSATASFGPIEIIGNKVFLMQMINPYFGKETLKKSPVSITVDTLINKIQSLPLRYPPVVSVEDILNHQTYANEFNVYRCFNKQQFVYSFSFDEDIYVTSTTHDTITKVKAKSKYIDKLQPIKSGITDPRMALKRMAEVAMYRNILYDPFREVYYRFVYIENELNENENFPDQLRYGHSLFSILILDKSFNVIGETLFPEFIYNPTLAFVDEDGFYISDSHFKNPDYDEDTLSFKKFILQKH